MSNGPSNRVCSCRDVLVKNVGGRMVCSTCGKPIRWTTPEALISNGVNTARIVRAAAKVPEICMHNVKLGQGCFCPHCPTACFGDETPGELARLREEVRIWECRAERAEDFLDGYSAAPSCAKSVLAGEYDYEFTRSPVEPTYNPEMLEKLKAAEASCRPVCCDRFPACECSALKATEQCRHRQPIAEWCGDCWAAGDVDEEKKRASLNGEASL